LPKLNGPDLWYQGRPNLIWFAKFYRRTKPDITMKELQARRIEVDNHVREQIETLTAVKEATEIIRKSPNCTTRMISIFERNMIRLDSGLSTLRQEWDMIDGACNELEAMKK
jgi:hypothetical protein